MKVSDAFPSNYLKAADLQGRDVAVKIRAVTMEDVGDDHKPVVYFEGKDKGLVLNKTNANNIAVMYGDDTDRWIGEAIVIFPTQVDFQGKSVAAIRVKIGSPSPMPKHRAPPAAVTGGGGPANLDADEIPFIRCDTIL